MEHHTRRPHNTDNLASCPPDLGSWGAGMGVRTDGTNLSIFPDVSYYYTCNCFILERC